nr:MAG TPA: hypothetical protein [Caudoviricetes sp.]
MPFRTTIRETIISAMPIDRLSPITVFLKGIFITLSLHHDDNSMTGLSSVVVSGISRWSFG